MIGAVLVVLCIIGVLGSAGYFLSGLFGPRQVDDIPVWPPQAPEEYIDQEFPEPVFYNIHA